MVDDFAGGAMQYQERLDFALEATRTGLWTFDDREEMVTCDDIVQAVIGFNAGSALPLERFYGLFDRADDERIRLLIHDPAVAMDGVQEAEFRIRRIDTNIQRWIAVRVRRMAGQPCLLGSLRDITERKRDDAQVHMLMREVTHRSKNLLAIIQAMARQTVKDSLSAAEFEGRFSARLRGLSFSHELLASQDWRGASLTELAEGHLSQLRERHGARVQIAGPIVFIRPEAAQNIGLALNELGSNAQRFGALSGERGTVRLEWHIDADETGPHALHLLWSEAGSDTEISPPLRQGFGHRVMERVVARALDATVTMHFAPTGLRWWLKIPLSHIASDTAT